MLYKLNLLAHVNVLDSANVRYKNELARVLLCDRRRNQID